MLSNTGYAVRMMMKIDTCNGFAVALLLLIVCSNRSESAESDLKNLINNKNCRASEKKEAGDHVAVQIIDAARALFSLQTSSYQRMKSFLLQQAMNLGFRGDSERIRVDEEAKVGVTEKVKEAVVQSFDKSRVTMEDSAKSAAKFAEDAVDRTVNKLKKASSVAADHQAEL